jgi:hypothetical protein
MASAGARILEGLWRKGSSWRRRRREREMEGKEWEDSETGERRSRKRIGKQRTSGGLPVTKLVRCRHW